MHPPGTAAQPVPAPSARREVPVSRTALWWCLGLGLGMVLGELIQLLTPGERVLPALATASPEVASAVAVWPWGLAAASGALLLVGMRPVARVAVDRRTAVGLRRTGRPAIAKVMRVSDPAPGPRALVAASLLVLSPTGRIYSSDVHWMLDPVDAGSLRTGAVIPVRVDPQAPHTVALDTLADSRARMDGIDPETAFSTRRRLRQLVTRMRGWSRIAVLAGAVGGALIVVI